MVASSQNTLFNYATDRVNSVSVTDTCEGVGYQYSESCCIHDTELPVEVAFLKITERCKIVLCKGYGSATALVEHEGTLLKVSFCCCCQAAS